MNGWVIYIVYFMWFDKKFLCVHSFVYYGKIRRSKQLHLSMWKMVWLKTLFLIPQINRLNEVYSRESEITELMQFKKYPKNGKERTPDNYCSLCWIPYCFKVFISTTEIIQFYYLHTMFFPRNHFVYVVLSEFCFSVIDMLIKQVESTKETYWNLYLRMNECRSMMQNGGYLVILGDYIDEFHWRTSLGFNNCVSKKCINIKNHLFKHKNEEWFCYIIIQHIMNSCVIVNVIIELYLDNVNFSFFIWKLFSVTTWSLWQIVCWKTSSLWRKPSEFTRYVAKKKMQETWIVYMDMFVLCKNQ